MFTYIDQIVRRLTSYPWYEVIVELALIWACVYVVLRFLRGTRGAGVVKGFAFLLIILTLLIRVLGGWAEAFTRINFIYDRFLGLVAIMLIVVFQPELRRAMVRLGETRLFRSSRRATIPVVDSVSEAVEFLSKNQFGALIAIERDIALGALAETGVQLDARISGRLLQSIFWPNNPLHDLGVIVQGNRILAAGVQFPLMEEGVAPPELGSRHRAGLGLSAETDALVVIVSEETGQISLAESGRLERGIPRNELAGILLRRLRPRAALDMEQQPADAQIPHQKVEPAAPAASAGSSSEAA